METQYIWPVHGPITSCFGLRADPFTGEHRFHGGVDIAAVAGTPAKAAAAGMITHAGYFGEYGLLVQLTHSTGGLSTWYAHLSVIPAEIQLGRQVRAGDVIGYVGSTGKSTGPHLHFEVRCHERRWLATATGRR